MNMGNKDPQRYWPTFLNLIDSSPAKAADQFYHFISGIFQASPPRVFRFLSQSEQENIKHDIFIHCIDNDFAILRKYENKGRPFAAWFYFICRNCIVNYLRKLGREAETFIREVEIYDSVTSDRHPDPKAVNPVDITEQRELLDKINELIEQLGSHCQVLLRLASDEFKPKEMERILRNSGKSAKQLSDDLRYCREKLLQLLVKDDIDINEYGIEKI